MEQKQNQNLRSWIIGLGVLLLVITIFQSNVSKPGSEVVACPVGCSVETDPPIQGPLRILSLNMLHGHPDFAFLDQRIELLSQEIGRLEVDIVLLQEVPWNRKHGQTAQQLAEQGGFNYAYYRANGNLSLIGFEEGSTILSRFPLENISFAELLPRAGFFENRIVLHATALTPQGPLDLFVTHLTDGMESVNAAQIESLLAFVQNEAKHPAIVAGDFNAVEDSPQIIKLVGLWQDSYRLANPEAVGATCCVVNLSNGSAAGLQKRIDYLFLAPEADRAITEVEITRVFAEPFKIANGTLWLSDHAGLLATINIESRP
ncbi:MAG: hypothetical protein DHS20C20_09950 [Ardenticatenaceae bacterium]|nr:MAG: hypothetical protein DHS20C20_09950 [Ardenticatenaceae bacterium]